MSPFRNNPVKWDGEDDGGKYKNVEGFKYDIVKKSVVCNYEEMPRCFLAETHQEAEKIYKAFEQLLNNIAYSYSIASGVDRADLFREALIGLARGYRDWDSGRSSNFRMYAVFRIREALNEYVRQNATAVSTPSYVKKANSNLKRLRDLCRRYEADWRVVANGGELTEFSKNDIESIERYIFNITAAAERAKVEYSKFVERILLLPEIVEYSDNDGYDQDKEQDRVESAILVNRLKDDMSEEELKICDGIMKDKSLEAIGKELGKSKAWVSGKLKVLRERVLSVVEG